MNAYEKLVNIQKNNKSMLCVGLDTDINRLPNHMEPNLESLLEFNRAIIQSTKDVACSYKINFAFYEQYGVEGFQALKATFDMIPENIFTIADAKRGDIGNTSKAYAKSAFEYFNADSVTVNPYMGHDSVMPFLDYKDKMIFLLAITSNNGSTDFQRLVADRKTIYRHVIEKSKDWAPPENMGYVIGATHPDVLRQLRSILPENCFLIPGIGVQGGSVEETIRANNNGLALVNVSRSIIYASHDMDFDLLAREKSIFYKNSFNEFIEP
jgi:orotidine-5'-phosphate decarboxylase